MNSDAFARQLAHELRTPLGQIEAIAELLLEQGCSGPQARQWLVRQSQLARQMQDTMACLLDLARAHRPLQVEDVDLSGLCERVRSDTPDGPRRAPVQWRIAPGLCSSGTSSSATADGYAPWERPAAAHASSFHSACRDLGESSGGSQPSCVSY